MGANTQAVESQEADEATAALEGSDESSDKGDEGEGKEEGKEGEVKTDEEKAAEAEAERQKPQEIEESGMKRMETEEEVAARIAGEEKPSEINLLQDEVKDLRQLLRTSKREQTQLQAKMERLGKRAVATEGDEEELDEDGKPIPKKEEPLSRVEELQQGIAQIGKERGASLDVLLETMEQNPKYANVKEVCSRANFDDIFEVIATEIVNDKGGNIDEALLEVEFSTWNRANPYSYMYDLITKYHPAYTAKTEAKPGGNKGEEGKKKEPVKAPGSIAGLGGDSDVKGGWTAAKIDGLPEDELDTVPKDVYEKYMKNELD